MGNRNCTNVYVVDPDFHGDKALSERLADNALEAIARMMQRPEAERDQQSLRRWRAEVSLHTPRERNH